MKPTNKDYIEITANSVTVGGVPATTYRGEQIWCVEALPRVFQDIQKIVQREYGAAPIEMRVMSSETNGEYIKPGNPSPKHGSNGWVSFVFANEIETDWVCRDSELSASACAFYCAYDCGCYVRDYSDFRSGVFGPHADAIKKLANKAQQLYAPVTQSKPKPVSPKPASVSEQDPGFFFFSELFAFPHVWQGETANDP